MDEPLFDIEVPLAGGDGNAFAIIGKVQRALRDAGAQPFTVEEFVADAMSGDYDHVLQTCMRYVHVS